MALIDPVTGKPFPPSMLTRPVAEATLTGARPAVSTMDMSWVDPDYVGEMLRAASNGDSLAWQTFAELIEQKDLHYLGVISTRKRTVSQLPITVDAAGNETAQEKHAAFIRDWLAKGILQRAMFDMLDAVAKGWSVQAIKWHAEAGNYWPERLIYRPQRWFDISWQDGETVKMRSGADARYTPKIDLATPEIGFEELAPRSIVVHRHPSWSGLTITQGLTRAIAFNSLFKMFSSRDWGVFVQAYGMPIRIGKYGRDSTADDRSTLWRALIDIAGSLACMVPESMQLEFVEPKNGAGSNDVYERRAKWLDEQTSKAVLGQVGTTDARQGTHAAAVIHRQVQDDIERADAMLLSQTINEQIVRPMIDLSFGVPRDGLYPTIRVGRPDEAPMSDVISALQYLGPQGLRVKAEDILSRLNLSPPEDGDAVIGAPLPAPNDKVESSPQRFLKRPTQRVSRHSLAPAQSVNDGVMPIDIMTNKLHRAAQPSFDAMIDQVRDVMDEASSLEDFRDRLDDLDLDDDAFATVLAQFACMAELAGEAAIQQDMDDERGA